MRKLKLDIKLFSKCLSFVFYAVVGGVSGYIFLNYIEKTSRIINTPFKIVIDLLSLFVIMYVGIFVNIIIHELGHLAFGVLSGYKFSSFRVLKYMWIKVDGKIELKKQEISGTGGQCLMIPPKLVDGKIPFLLYNIGGSLMNILVSGMLILIAFLLKQFTLIFYIMLLLSIIGIVVAISNIIPMKSLVSNDGYNIYLMLKNKKAIEAFWVQMKLNELLTRGVRIKDMPGEMFDLPQENDLDNEMISSLVVFSVARLMDMHEFKMAEKTIEHYLTQKAEFIELYINLMKLDLMCCRLYDGDLQKAQKIFDDNLKKFAKGMSSNLAVLRSCYTFALLNDNDLYEASLIKGEFELQSETYPYKSDIESEAELINVADMIYAKSQEKLQNQEQVATKHIDDKTQQEMVEEEQMGLK